MFVISLLLLRFSDVFQSVITKAWTCTHVMWALLVVGTGSLRNVTNDSYG